MSHSSLLDIIKQHKYKCWEYKASCINIYSKVLSFMHIFSRSLYLNSRLSFMSGYLVILFFYIKNASRIGSFHGRSFPYPNPVSRIRIRDPGIERIELHLSLSRVYVIISVISEQFSAVQTFNGHLPK